MVKNQSKSFCLKIEISWKEKICANCAKRQVFGGREPLGTSFERNAVCSGRLKDGAVQL